MSLARRQVEKKLAPAGIQLNSSQPWDIAVHDKRLLMKVVDRELLKCTLSDTE